jgi:hypothetical protein
MPIDEWRRYRLVVILYECRSETDFLLGILRLSSWPSLLYHLSVNHYFFIWTATTMALENFVGLHPRFPGDFHIQILPVLSTAQPARTTNTTETDSITGSFIEGYIG